MRTSSLAAAVATVALLAAAGCAPAIHVRTAADPEANLATLRTFRVLPTPTSRGAAPTSKTDPMLQNSIMNRALRQDLAQAFERRDYSVDTTNPNFAVAYYTSAKDKLNVTYWDYGYPFWRPWRWWGWYGGPAETVSQYTQGTVIVDVIDPNTKQLLWRGQGVSDVSDNPQKYAQELEKTITAIVDKFPRAAAHVAETN
jgi:Domain of unknown function (DUF4136)